MNKTDIEIAYILGYKKAYSRCMRILDKLIRNSKRNKETKYQEFCQKKSIIN